MKQIATIHTDFPTKFGLPRQSGLVNSIKGRITFEKEFQNREAFRGLEEFSHIWLLWEFSESKREDWSPTVRPPKLGGNTRKGVFATRSPFRPNPIGLSCVRLDRIEYSKEFGPVLHVSGADMMDGTPIYDVKPYLPYADSFPDASGGFTDAIACEELEVVFEPVLLDRIPEEKREELVQALRQDPRPGYQHEDGRRYGFVFAKWEIAFEVAGNILNVLDVKEQGRRG